MDPTRPTRLIAPRAVLPYGDADGAVIPHAGRYARECVLVAFEMIGGVERMASWATANPGEFFTKLYPKVITKEVELHASAGIEDLLARLDDRERRGGPVEDASFEIVEDE
jgi:hypothetical protein